MNTIYALRITYARLTSSAESAEYRLGAPLIRSFPRVYTGEIVLRFNKLIAPEKNRTAQLTLSVVLLASETV